MLSEERTTSPRVKMHMCGRRGHWKKSGSSTQLFMVPTLPTSSGFPLLSELYCNDNLIIL